MNVSFYLLNPDAGSTAVYISLTRKGERQQFASGFSFLTAYCNKGRIKGGKPLVRKSSAFHIEYNALLRAATERLHRIALHNPAFTLRQVREAYELETGRRKAAAAPPATMQAAFPAFIRANTHANGWSDAYAVIVEALRKHLVDFEAWRAAPVRLDALDGKLWIELAGFFSTHKRLSNNTSNKYLKAFRSFWRWCISEGHAPAADFKDMEYLKELEPFKIALREEELQGMASLDLAGDTRLEKVRDLFLLECLTGQRYSDIHKVLDTANHDEEAIIIYQQKGTKQVRIPTHPKLLAQLDVIAARYPSGMPEISNQKFNDYLKEVCRMCGMARVHRWQMLRGNVMEPMHDYRYNLVSSHTGRRTFCTIAMRRGIDIKTIMSVSGHATVAQFMEYVKVDDTHANEQFAKF